MWVPFPPLWVPFVGYFGVRIKMQSPWTRNRIPLDCLVQVCENIASMVTQCQNALSFGVWHFLERVAKPGDLAADLPANWHSRSHFETPRHSHNLFRSWPLSPCACAGRSGRAAQRQPPVAPGSTRLFVRFRALLGSTHRPGPGLAAQQKRLQNIDSQP